MAGSHEMSSTIGVPDSVHATGSLSGMFDDAATSTVATAAAAAAATVTEPALGVSEQQSIDAANVGSTANASQPASSSPGPSARHGSAERVSPARASPLRRTRAVPRPASEGPAVPSPTVPGIRSTRTLSPQGMPGPTGLLEAMSIRMDVLESTLQPDTMQTLLQLESKLHTYMEDVQQRLAVAEAT